VRKNIDQENFAGCWRDDFEEYAWVPADFSRGIERQRNEAHARIKELELEIETLRQYGNKDCTAMADEAINTRRVS